MIVKYKRRNGINIVNNCDIHYTCSFNRGYANGKNGKLSIGAKVKTCRGVAINCYGGEVRIHSNVFIGEYVVIYGHGSVEIGENTLVAMHSCIISSNHTVPNKNLTIRSQPDILLPVKIGNDVWIGAGVKILGGVTIANGCVVGAGSVVTKNLPPFSVALGNPAKVIRFRNG